MRLSEFVPDLMLKATEYSNRSDNPYTFTASMIGNEVLQNYLTVVNGTFPTKKIDDTTTGSIFHKGMEQIIKEDARIPEGFSAVHAESNLQVQLGAWTISGTADLKMTTSDLSFVKIDDFKLTKMYAIGKIREDLHNHNYTKQLNVLRWLDVKYYKYFETPEYELVIDAFAKDPKAINGEEVYNPIQAPILPLDVVEAELLQKTNELQQYIESGDIPPQCTDLWPRRMRNGTTLNTKCALYCSHGKSGKCPYFNPNTRETVARVSNW